MVRPGRLNKLLRSHLPGVNGQLPQDGHPGLDPVHAQRDLAEVFDAQGLLFGVVGGVVAADQVDGALRLDNSRSGHSLNSILLTFHNQGSVLKSAFSTNAQSRFASVVVDGVLGPLRLALHT